MISTSIIQYNITTLNTREEHGDDLTRIQGETPDTTESVKHFHKINSRPEVEYTYISLRPPRRECLAEFAS
jgi:hypothetical protein